MNEKKAPQHPFRAGAVKPDAQSAWRRDNSDQQLQGCGQPAGDGPQDTERGTLPMGQPQAAQRAASVWAASMPNDDMLRMSCPEEPICPMYTAWPVDM